MRNLNLTERERAVVVHALNAVRLHRDPRVFVYACKQADNVDLAAVLADVIEKLHTAPQTRARAASSGRHRWPRHGNICEACGLRRTRYVSQANGEHKIVTRYYWKTNPNEYLLSVPCPGGSK